MSMEDILKVLMQTTAGAQQQPSAGSGDAMAQALGGLLGGSQQSGGGGDVLSQALGGLLGGSQQSGGGGDVLAQALGGLLGGSQQGGGGNPTSQLLGGLQQIIGGQPGSGQLPMGGGAMTMGAGNPIMMMLQPVVNQLAAKANLSPQIATVIASIAVHYLLQSHPNTPGASPLNLGNVMQTLASGGRLSPSTLQESGMLNDVVQATGLNQDQALKSLNKTFMVLGNQVQGAAIAGKAPKRRKK